MSKRRLSALVLGCALTWCASARAEGGRVKSLKITVLSTMLADAGIGEGGFAALVEVDGRRILFDTGARPSTVLENARELNIDLSNVTESAVARSWPAGAASFGVWNLSWQASTVGSGRGQSPGISKTPAKIASSSSSACPLRTRC